MQPLKVCYVLKRYPKFSETFIVNEILGLERQGIEVSIAALRPSVEDCFHENLARVKAKIRYIPYHTNGKSVRIFPLLARVQELCGRALLQLPQLLSEDPVELEQGLQVAAYCAEQDCQVIHAHFGTTSSSVARIAGKLLGRPYSFTAHAKDIYHEDVDHQKLAQRLLEAAVVVTVSDFNLQHLCTRYPQAAANVTRIYNGMELNRLQYQPRSEAEIAGCNLLTVGRLIEKKGIADLLQALALMRPQQPKLRCEIVGDGELKLSLMQLAKTLAVDDIVTFHGVQPQGRVFELMRQATLFVAPCVVSANGDRDGLPTVLLEAMALGLPCITTPVTGIPEMIEDGITGALVPPNNPQQLASVCIQYIENVELANAVAFNARRKVDSLFDVDKSTARLAGVWRHILLNSKTAREQGGKHANTVA